MLGARPGCALHTNIAPLFVSMASNSMGMGMECPALHTERFIVCNPCYCLPFFNHICLTFGALNTRIYSNNIRIL